MIHLVIPALPPSLNRLLNMHWAKRARIKKEWQRLVWAAKNSDLTKVPAEEHGRRTVNLEYYFPTHRRRDVDNYQKVILDALTENGLIVDDSPECVEVSVKFLMSCDHPRTEIRICDAAVSGGEHGDSAGTGGDGETTV